MGSCHLLQYLATGLFYSAIILSEMNENIPHAPLEPGIFQGSPNDPTKTLVPPPRLIRTMRGDMAEAAKSQNETLVSIALGEEKQAALRAQKQSAESSSMPAPAPKPFGRIVIIFMALLILAGAGLAVVFLLPKLTSIKLPNINIPSFGDPDATPVATTTDPIIQVPTIVPSIIPAQSERRISLNTETPEQIFANMVADRTRGLTNGEIKNFFISEGITDSLGAKSEKEISANRLFILVNTVAPESLTRTLEEPFMVGLIGESDNTATPFIILKVGSYETGLAGMLAWEDGVARFFDVMFFGNNGTFDGGRFHDILVRERDARIAPSVNGAVAYAFADLNTIIVATSQNALEKLLDYMVK